MTTDQQADSVAALGPYDLYMLFLSAFSIAVIAADALLAMQPNVHAVLNHADTALCGMFFLDFVRNLVKAPRRWRHFARGGWLDLASSIPTIDALRFIRLIRIARIVRLFRAMRSARIIGKMIASHPAGSATSAAAVVSIVMIVFASIAVLQFEQDPESNIKSGGDALWWAVTTISTVGYGERYPVTVEGRLVAMMLMAVGVGLFGTFSGLVASWFLQAEDQKEAVQIAALTSEVARLAILIEARGGGLHRAELSVSVATAPGAAESNRLS